MALRIIKEFAPHKRLEVPSEIKKMYPDGVFSFLNPNSPSYIDKIAEDSGVELVKVTDPDIKKKYANYIEPGTNFYRIADAILAVQHIETKKAKDSYVASIVDRKLPKLLKKNKDDFSDSNEFAKKGQVITTATIETQKDGHSSKISV